MTTRDPRPTRFLSVAFDGSYGIKQINVCVCVEMPDDHQTYRESAAHTARATGAFSGESLEDFRISAYAGHAYPASYQEPDEVWGWSEGFTPSQIRSVAAALRIARTLGALDRAMEKLAYGPDGPGAPTSFPDFLRRMAAILRATSIRIYQPASNGRSFLGPSLPLTTGPDLVETIGRAWATGESVEAICRRLTTEAREEAAS